ncbi:YceI family protein [Aquimarina sp. AU474]|uniref:YceI family protein n=1 Tax=Aquimarina sp. AU474 TaxID=2108529 RepID=UPI000D69AF0D|nr:YceI family protein [Aquimarina sp. AU474]
MKNFKIMNSLILLCIISLSCAQHTKNDKFTVTTSGLQYKIVKQGNGSGIHKGQEILIHQTTKYRDSSVVFSSNKQIKPIKILIDEQETQGLNEGLIGMKIGEIRKLIVPPSLYIKSEEVTFSHPDSILIHEIKLVDIVTETSTHSKQGEARTIDVEKSYIEWTGYDAFKFNNHFGRISFKSGKWLLEDDIINGGQFVVDMNTIINTDGEYSPSLIDHLKDEDFFETNVYPISKLEITKMDYTNHPNVKVEANLTIKGITQPIQFDGIFTISDQQTIFTSKFVIDRTRWNVMYKSGSIYKDLGDKALSDDIDFNVVIYLQ